MLYLIKLIGKTITPMTDEQREQYNNDDQPESWNGGDQEND